MKKINKVMTVNVTANVEVLPLSSAFVARIMHAQSSLTHANNSIAMLIEKESQYVEEGSDMSTLKSIQDDISESLNFYEDVYRALTEDDTPEEDFE